MSQENPREHVEKNNVDKDLNDILDAVNDGQDNIVELSPEDQTRDQNEQPDDHDGLEKLRVENEQLKEDLLRVAADMQNLRKRTQREIADTKAFSISGFARDMLSVADNLRRTIEATPKQEEGAIDENLKTLLEGVEMTERSMLSAIERHGVKKLEVSGKKFDPNFHQAMFEVPDTETPNNTVVQVVQDGYIIGNRVLRPAMVGVAKGGPKHVDQEENS